MVYKPKRYSTEIKKVNDDGSVRFRLTSKKVDRHGEVVLPDGIILDDFKNNPVVLFGHGWGGAGNNVPIGKINIDSFKITSKYVDADVVFDDEGKDPFAEMIGDKVRNGFLNAGSIGFRPTVISADPVLPKQKGATITEWELFEFSIVTIPSNADALAKRDFINKCKTLAPDLDDSIFAPDIIKTKFDFESELIEKEGRVLSSKNRKLVKNVASSLEDLLNVLKALLEATESKPADEKDLDLEELREQKRTHDVLIKQTLEAIETTTLINNINDLKRIV